MGSGGIFPTYHTAQHLAPERLFNCLYNNLEEFSMDGVSVLCTRLEPSSQGTGHPDLAGSAKPGLSSRPAWFTRNGVWTFSGDPRGCFWGGPLS